MAYCEIGELNQRNKQAVGGCAVRVEGKDCICPNQGKPLAVWVRTGYIIFADAFGITEMCIDCYKNIFGSPPMPSAYQGRAGRLMTQDVSDQEYADACKNYVSYFDQDLPSAPAVPAPAPPALPPAVPDPAANRIKPKLVRQNAMFFNMKDKGR